MPANVSIRIKKTLGLCAVAALCNACGGGGGQGQGPGTNPPPPAPSINRAPYLRPGLTSPVLVEAHPVDFNIAQYFFDPDGDAMNFRIVFKQAQPDGRWQGLRAEGGRIVGVPNRTGVPTTWAQTGVTIDLDDGRGGTAHEEIVVTIQPNTAPVVARPNADRVLSVGANVDHDVTGSGGAFTDADGDALAYEIALPPQARGLRVEGTRVRGVLNSMGGVFVRVRASDGFGGAVEDVFAIAAPVPETRRPALPAVSYVYEDAQLTLPAIARFSREHFAPLWDTTIHSGNPTTNAGATLGRVLFYDRRLSITNMGSCGSCHHQEHGFAAPERFSVGPHGDLTRRNVMGLTSVRYNLDNRYFSDRRVVALEQLVVQPIEDPTELGNALPLLVEKLAATDFYPPLFEEAFGTRDITAERIAKALSQFLRSMIAFNTRFDRAYQPTEDGAQPQPDSVLSPQELRGAEIFNGPGHCFFCHAQGAQTMDAETNNAMDAQPADPGSGNGNFRAASLRNVAVTAPYMHDGRFATLRDVIEHYSSGVIDTSTTDPRLRGMLLTNSANLNLSEADKDALEAFLKTLTDQEFLADPKFSNPFP